jgi:hypothetical protein
MKMRQHDVAKKAHWRGGHAPAGFMSTRRFCFFPYGKRGLAGPKWGRASRCGGNLFCGLTASLVCPAQHALPPFSAPTSTRFELF